MRRIALGSIFCFSCLALGCGTARHVATDGGGPADDTGASVAPDAWTASVDAWVDPSPDAWSGVCPTYSGDVEPIYQLHCASCHTTGTAVHFGTSYSIAAQASSACGRTVSMGTCTIQLGRPGGSMARNDRLGGFAQDELLTLQAWVSCNTPM